MTPQKSQELVTKFPRLFTTGNQNEPCLRHGLECGDGWYSLIHAFCVSVSFMEKQYHCSFKFEQIKEKFGGLRVYYALTDIDRDKVHEIHAHLNALTDLIQRISLTTCEITGAPGKLYTKGWHRVLCEEEALKLGYIDLPPSAVS